MLALLLCEVGDDNSYILFLCKQEQIAMEFEKEMLDVVYFIKISGQDSMHCLYDHHPSLIIIN